MVMAFKLPQMQTLSQLSTKWAAIINPLLSNPANNSLLLQNIALASGNNSVNHMLGRKLQGWKPIRFHGSYADLYDLQDTNQTPELTLVLNASAPVTIDLEVF